MTTFAQFTVRHAALPRRVRTLTNRPLSEVQLLLHEVRDEVLVVVHCVLGGDGWGEAEDGREMFVSVEFDEGLDGGGYVAAKKLLIIIRKKKE